MSVEDRVRAATRARAGLVRDIGPLDLPGVGQMACGSPAQFALAGGVTGVELGLKDLLDQPVVAVGQGVVVRGGQKEVIPEHPLQQLGGPFAPDRRA